MKNLGYLLFALFFNLSRIFSVQNRKVVLYNGHFKGLSGNLLEMKTEIEDRKSDAKIYYFEKNAMFSETGLKKIKGYFTFFVLLAYHMATAGQVYFNDNFLPLKYCYPAKNAQLIQLWHGAGAFKKFGLTTERDRKVKGKVKQANDRFTHLFVTSKQVIPFYEWAFAIPRRKIFATGVPVTDIYFDENRIMEGKRHFFKEYPSLEGRKFLLITPTIRNTDEENQEMLSRLPVQQMHKVLGDRWIFLLRMHPKISTWDMPRNEYCINVTNYKDITELFFVSDFLITDYSSTVVEYVLLNKPIVLYAYDLEKYDRGFYRDYRETAAGTIVQTEEELIEAIRHPQDTEEKRKAFIQLQYDFLDKSAAERIWRVLEETK